MKNLKSSNAKRRKFSYYFYYIPLVCFLPSIISRLRLRSILKNKNSHQEYVKSRVRYYSKKTSNFKVSKNAKNLSELFWNQIFKNKQNSHFIDFYLLLQFFNQKNKDWS